MMPRSRGLFSSPRFAKLPQELLWQSSSWFAKPTACYPSKQQKRSAIVEAVGRYRGRGLGLGTGLGHKGGGQGHILANAKLKQCFHNKLSNTIHETVRSFAVWNPCCRKIFAMSISDGLASKYLSMRALHTCTRCGDTINRRATHISTP